MVKILAEDDLLTPINWSKLPNVRRNIDPKFRKLPFDPQDRYSVAKDWGTTGFVYRTDKIKERPKSWEQFFALFEKYPRKFTLLDGSPETWRAAGLALAATPDDPPDADCIDFLFFTAARHEGDAEAARAYLAWETDLIAQLDAQERGAFRIA